MPDFLHCMQELGKGYALAISRRLRQAQQEFTKATETLARRQGPSPGAQPGLQAKVLVEARQVAVTSWAGVYSTYCHHTTS